VNPEDLNRLIPLALLVLVMAGLFYLAMPSASELAIPPKTAADELVVLENAKQQEVLVDSRDPFVNSGVVGEMKKGFTDIDNLELQKPLFVKRERPKYIVTGIFISGQKRMAFIDGHLRKEGQQFDGTRLDKVLVDKIILRTPTGLAERRLKMPSVTGSFN
jgi:hypothetical protein